MVVGGENKIKPNRDRGAFRSDDDNYCLELASNFFVEVRPQTGRLNQ
jgi:hypothetical protein